MVNLESRVEQRIMIRSAMNCCCEYSYLKMVRETLWKMDFPYRIKRNYDGKLTHRIELIYGKLEK